MGKKTDELAKVVNDFGPLATLAGDASPHREALEANAAGNLDLWSLDGIKVPAGGTTSWELAELGLDNAPHIDGVMLWMHNVRVYYDEPFTGAGGPPSCTSNDCETGVPRAVNGEALDYGGACHACPKSRFGTATNEKGDLGAGQACSERKIILLLVEGLGILPIRLSAPPTSVKAVERYSIMVLANKHALRYWHAVTRLKLKKEANKGGIEYSAVEPEFLGALSEDMRAAADAYRDDILASTIDAATRQPTPAATAPVAEPAETEAPIDPE